MYGIVLFSFSFLLSFCMADAHSFFSWWLTLSLGAHIAYMDYREYYVSPVWMALSTCLIVLWKRIDVVCCLLYVIPVFILYRWKRWMGSADVFYIGLFALVLGQERMFVCMLISIGLGFCLGYKRLIPFVSCLWVGFVLSLRRGFLMYGILMAWK